MMKNEIMKSIMNGNWSADEIAEFFDAVESARATLTIKNRRSFAVNDTVEFDQIVGFITKINRKTAIVKTAFGGPGKGRQYKVPLSMLK